MGFFECVNDQEAAFKLFDACKKWLIDRGMAAMDGPVNFGEKDELKFSFLSDTKPISPLSKLLAMYPLYSFILLFTERVYFVFILSVNL